MQRRMLILSIGVAIALAAWILVRVASSRRLQAEFTAARADFDAGRFAIARRRLEQLARQSPGRGNVEYLLGLCERFENNPDAAFAAWRRVPPDAPEADVAALATGTLALENGRFALAESSLERASRAGKNIGAEARKLLGRVNWITGRHDDYIRFLRSQAERERNPSETLRTLWSVDTVAYPIDAMRSAVGKALAAAPDDDRVWLALADVATRSGRFDEANDWLSRCEGARPGDKAVWDARLRWAKAADRPDEVVRAAGHLPISSISKSRVLELQAWLAARIGDERLERTSLEALLEVEPADTAALDRLTDIVARKGDVKTVAELRQRKAKIDAIRERHRALANLTDLSPKAAELARAAEALGRRFDARAWWRLAANLDPTAQPEADAALKRIKPEEPAAEPDGRMLAELLPGLPSPPSPKAVPSGMVLIPEFADEAAARGLVFTFENGRSEERQLPETMSGGVAVLDFDGDGWLDVYAIQGGAFPPRDARPSFGDRLFRNTGGGRFKDVTQTSGLAAAAGGYGHGIAVGDYDNDGRPDLFLTRWGSYALYHNLGQGSFEDVTTKAGLAGPRECPTSAAWADLDNDGDLDLYVCHYLKWDAVNPTLCQDPPRSGNTYCDPRHFAAVPDHVFRNDGGRFIDVTAQAGIVDREGRGLGVIAADLDADGKVDLFVANDTTANYFFHNQGGFRFTEEGLESGLATNAGGGYLAGMGIACGDFDGDDRLDLAVTNFYGESTTLYHNLGNGLFSDRTAAAGLAAPTHFVLGFGLAALDANNDGNLDLAQANGHTNDYLPTTPYAMPAQLFLGDGAGKLRDVSSKAGAPWSVLRLARGLATGDFDNDGRIDVLMVSGNEPLALFHNGGGEKPTPSQAPIGHFVTILLEGTASNRDGVGARVALTVAGRGRIAQRFGGGSYLSASDRRLHFGLGTARKADRIAVKWPKGRVDVYNDLQADTGYLLREGETTARILPGFPADKSLQLSGPK